MKVLEVFHHRIARKITGKTDRRIGEEGWESPRGRRPYRRQGCGKCRNIYGGDRQPLWSTLQHTRYLSSVIGRSGFQGQVGD